MAGSVRADRSADLSGRAEGLPCQVVNRRIAEARNSTRLRFGCWCGQAPLTACGCCLAVGEGRAGPGVQAVGVGPVR